MKAFENIFDLISKELKTILTSFSIMTVILAGNVLYAFFYPSPYLNDVLLKQKIAVVDEDRTQKSREFIFNANAHIRTDIIANTSMQNAKNMLLRNEIYGILYIPQDFEKKGITASLPKVYYIANNSYFLIYSSILEGLNTAAGAIDFHTQQRLFSDTKPKAEPLKAEFVALFNPSVGYLNYILAVILIFILHQTLVISCGILCGTQIQQYNQFLINHSRTNLAINSPQGFLQSIKNIIKNPNDDLYFLRIKSPAMLIFARIVAFGIIYFPLFLFYFGFIYSFYNLTTFASGLNLILFGIAFIVATSAFSICLGFSFNRREYVPQITLVMSMPLLFGLGVIWPSQSVPLAIQIFMDFIPITPSVSGFLKMNQMGAEFSDIWLEFLHLILLAIMYSLIAFLILKKRFNYGK